MTKTPKLTRLQRRLARGARLEVTFGGAETWVYSDTQRVASTNMCRKALAAGHIVGCGDGLLAGTDQTFRLAP